MIQISRRATRVSADEDAIAQARRTFAACHCLRLPGLIDEALAREVQARIRATPAAEKHHPATGRERMLQRDATVISLLTFVLNSPAFFRLLEEITDCGPIGCVQGRIYALEPGGGQAHDWHDDRSPHRLLSISINLSAGDFEGGDLEIRAMPEERVVHRVHNAGLGDAIVFRIADTLEHRVTPVTAGAARVAYAGWLMDAPAFWDSARRGSY